MQRLSEQSLLSALGESGSKTGLSLTPQHGSMSSAGLMSARNKLLSQSPQQTDRNLNQWLRSSLNVRPQEDVRMTYPATGGYKREVTGYSFQGLTSENRDQAREAVSMAMTPLEVEQCEELVAMLHAVTARRNEGDVALNIILSMYSRCLASYPADVANSVVQWFAERNEKPNFFPALSELKSELDRVSSSRRSLMEALNA